MDKGAATRFAGAGLVFGILVADIPSPINNQFSGIHLELCELEQV